MQNQCWKQVTGLVQGQPVFTCEFNQPVLYIALGMGTDTDDFDMVGRQRRIRNLLTWAVPILCGATVHDLGSYNSLPYLGMACGILGMLATRDRSVPFTEVMEPLRVAQVVQSTMRR